MRRKRSFGKIILAVMACLLLAVIIVCIARVNSKWPEPRENRYSLGDTVNSDGINYTFSNFEFYTVDGLCERYPEIDPDIFDIGNDYYGEAIESVFVLVDVYCQNVSAENVKVNFFEKMQLQVADNLLTCFDPYDLYPILNANKPLAGVMLPGHDIKLTLPFQLISTGFTDAEWDNLGEDTPYNIYFSIWPERNIVNINQAALPNA